MGIYGDSGKENGSCHLGVRGAPSLLQSSGQTSLALSADLPKVNKTVCAGCQDLIALRV